MSFWDWESLGEHTKAGIDAGSELGEHLREGASIQTILTDVGDLYLAGMGAGLDAYGLSGGNQCLAQLLLGEAAATPVLEAVAWALFGFDKMSGGPFNPDEGGKYSAGSDAFGLISSSLAAARPSHAWTGAASDAYRDRCDNQRVRAHRMQDADRRLAAIIRSEAEAVDNARRAWDALSSNVAIAIPVALALMAVPVTGILDSGVFQSGVAAMVLSAARVGFLQLQAQSVSNAAEIFEIANEYASIAATASPDGSRDDVGPGRVPHRRTGPAGSSERSESFGGGIARGGGSAPGWASGSSAPAGDEPMSIGPDAPEILSGLTGGLLEGGAGSAALGALAATALQTFGQVGQGAQAKQHGGSGVPGLSSVQATVPGAAPAAPAPDRRPSGTPARLIGESEQSDEVVGSEVGNEAAGIWGSLAGAAAGGAGLRAPIHQEVGLDPAGSAATPAESAENADPPPETPRAATQE